MKVSEILIRALERLGPNGEHWNNYRLQDHDTYCTLGAIQKEVYGCISRSGDQDFPAAIAFKNGIGGYEITSWNDNTKRDNFPRIKAGFCKAIKLALEEESKDV